MLQERGTEGEESAPLNLEKFLERRTFFNFWKGWEAGQRGKVEALKHDANSKPKPVRRVMVLSPGLCLY